MKPGSPLIYTAIGDSLSVGTGSLLSPGFEKRYAALAEQTLRRKIKVNIFAKNGATSTDILTSLYSENVREGIRRASIITLTAGGNDLIHAAKTYSRTGQSFVFQQGLQQFSMNLSQMMREIYAIKAAYPSPYVIRIVGLYNPYPRLPGSDFWVLSFNRHLKSFINVNTKVADIYYPFKQYGKSVLFFDGLHPNGKGYQLIAESLHRLGYFPLI